MPALERSNAGLTHLELVQSVACRRAMNSSCILPSSSAASFGSRSIPKRVRLPEWCSTIRPPPSPHCSIHHMGAASGACSIRSNSCHLITCLPLQGEPWGPLAEPIGIHPHALPAHQLPTHICSSARTEEQQDRCDNVGKAIAGPLFEGTCNEHHGYGQAEEQADGCQQHPASAHPDVHRVLRRKPCTTHGLGTTCRSPSAARCDHQHRM